MTALSCIKVPLAVFTLAAASAFRPEVASGQGSSSSLPVPFAVLTDVGAQQVRASFQFLIQSR